MELASFAECRRALLARETTCDEIVAGALDRVESVDDFNAFLSIDHKGALARAKELDRRIGDGTAPALAGLVVGVKDVIAVKDQPLTCASQILGDFKALFHATAVQRLVDAGAVVLGKLNCDQFGMGSSNETSFFGPVRHPANPRYVPGGSSGGSAAAVAAGLCHVALGSDTGGSVRQPAAFCGVVGLKPTYGRVSRFGLVAFASSLDCIGPIGRIVEDVALTLSVIAGADPNDSTSSHESVVAYAGTGEARSARIRVGLPAEYLGEGLDPEIRNCFEATVRQLQEQGVEFESVSLPHTEYGVATYYLVATAEASSNLGRFDGVRYGRRADDDAIRSHSRASTDGSMSVDGLYAASRSEGFGAEVKRRIMLGTFVLSAGYYDAYYDKAQRARRLIKQDFDNVFANVDLLLTPATPTPAFEIGSKVDNVLSMYLSDVYTVPASLAGIPGLVVPAGTHSTGLPIGLQILGPHFEEPRLLALGKQIERGFVEQRR